MIETQWGSQKPTFGRTFRALVKKNFLIKLRHPAAIIEFAIGCLIWVAIEPIVRLARDTFSASGTSPPYKFSPEIPRDLLTFFAYTEHPTVVGVPDNGNTRAVIDGIFEVMNDLPPNLTQFIRKDMVAIHYTNSLPEMENLIYASESNALGIYWVNSADPGGFQSPIFQIYTQSFGATPVRDLFDTLRRWVAVLPENQFAGRRPWTFVDFAVLNASFQPYAQPASENVYQVDIAIALFVVLPIFLTTMPDFQTLLEEKDSRVQTLAFLMGCPESAYFLASIVVQIALSLFSYILMCVCLSYWFCMTGVDCSLLILLAVLFVIGHIMFQMFLTTFMRKMATGRATTVVLAVLTVFFGHLHQQLTLDETNTSDALKHVMSLLPLSAYQLVMMAIYLNSWETLPPITWRNLQPETMIYPTKYGLIWLAVDCVIFFLLFCLFNLTNSRDFGTPLIRWREIFDRAAWHRVFHDEPFATISGNSEELIRVEGLSKTYYGEKKVVALTDVDFSIVSGEVIVVIGPNGAGKSTMMNILSGALEPSEGDLWILGNPARRFKVIQKYLGVCFQENVLIPLLTIREHFFLFGAFRGIKVDELKDAMDFFANTLQLREMLAARAGDLSGGQKRKLCISLSLLGNPPIVIMDEPTAGVDVQARQLIWKTISALKETTTIVTSHALEEAEAVSSRLFIVAGGKLPFSGTSTELREEFKCGYLLRIERPDRHVGPVLEFVKRYVPEAKITEDRDDTIAFPISKGIPEMLRNFEAEKEALEVRSYSLCVEQLEDMLLRLVMNEESQLEVGD